MSKSKDYIKEAKTLVSKAEKEFNRGKALKDETILRNACEKAWCATVQAINALCLKKTGKIPKSHWERRRLLAEFSKTDERIVSFYDRFMAREHILHEICFYDGLVNKIDVGEEIEKVKKLIEDIESI